MTDKIVEKYIKYYGKKYIKNEQEISNLLNQMNADGSWNDINYDGVNGSFFDCLLHIERLNSIALTQKYEAEVLLGLEYWFSKPKLDKNWWVNDIGIPMRVAISAVILRDRMNDELKEKILSCFNDYVEDKFTGTNRAWLAQNIIIKGIVKKDKELIVRGKKYLEDNIFISKVGEEGIQPDFAFAQHGAQIYNNGYGIPFLNDNCSWIDILEGTEFAFDRDKTDILASLLLDGMGHMCYGDVPDFNTYGRNIARGFNKNDVTTIGLTSAIDILKNNSERKDELEILKRFINGDKSLLNRTKMFSSLNILTVNRENYYASVRFGSDRVMGVDIADGKIINGEDKLSGLRGCFVSQYMVHGNEYSDIFPLWNWAFLPGVSCPSVELSTERGAIMKSSFAGGITDGINGVCAIDLKEDFSKESERVIFGGKKAVFVIDNEIINLGCDLYSETDLNTTLNQCRFSGEFIVDGKSFSLGEYTGNAKYIYHNDIGYVFNDLTDVIVKAQHKEGEWNRIKDMIKHYPVSENVFTAYIPQEKTNKYEYAVLCNADVEKTINYQFPDTINNNKIQAVKKGEIILAVAYEPYNDMLWNVNVSAQKPCFMIIKNGEIIKISN